MSNVIYEGAKDTAKKIRVELKKNFPGVKFSVRSSTYSMGSSVDVSWTDLPRQEEVDAILNKFQSGYFDGMQDMYISGSYEYEGKLYSGAKHVSSSRNLSAEYRNILEEKAIELFADYNENDYRYSKWIFKAEKVILDEIKADSEQTASTTEPTQIISNITNTVLDHVTVTPDVNTKTKENIFVVKLNSKIEYDTFKAFETEIKAIGGYYSRFKRGFIFADEPTEKLLTIDVTILTGTTQNINKDKIENNLHTEDTIELNSIEDTEIINSVTIEETEEPTQIKPISIENVEDQNIRIKGIFAALNKNNTIEEYKEEVERDCYANTCKITDIATLSPEDYEIFTHNLLVDFDFIAGKGGTNSDYETDKTEIFQLTKDEMTQFRKQSYNLCVLVKAEGKESILVNPQGYNYSRYVAFIESEPQQDKTPIEPIQETKVINITKINKTITTNSIDFNTTDTNDTTELTPEEQHIKNLFKSALNELIQEQIPSFNHEIKYKSNKAKIIDFSSYKQNKA